MLIRPDGKKGANMRPEMKTRTLRKTVGSHIADRVALGLLLMLCSKCASKFDRKKHRYFRSRRMPMACGKCDGCWDDAMCAAFFHEHSHQLDPTRGIERRPSEVRSLTMEEKVEHAVRVQSFRKGPVRSKVRRG